MKTIREQRIEQLKTGNVPTATKDLMKALAIIANELGLKEIARRYNSLDDNKKKIRSLGKNKKNYSLTL